MRHSCLLAFLILFLFQRPTFASKKSYVVYLGSHSHGPVITNDDRIRARDSHYEFLGSFLGSRESPEEVIFYSYTGHINGFAANLDQEVATKLSMHPNVVSIFLNQAKKLHTTHSWTFMGLEHPDGVVPSSSIWTKARLGENTIIGNLDTGVWPESKSFSDEGLGPIPPKWKGICQNSLDPSFHCNRKLIGARYFNKGYEAAVGKLNASYYSPRDIDGHGSHTLSTAGGSFVAGASVFGFGYGTAKGGSPKSRVATYRVCYPPVSGNECYDADVLAAFDAAITDGVHVLSVSLGGDPVPLFNDSVAIGSFHAVKHGIVVICSAGNSGPAYGTVANVAPWEITVGASTMDREFPSYVVLGNKISYKGQSLSNTALPRKKFFSLISGADAQAANASTQNALLCEAGALDPEKVKGKIVVCLRGITARVDKGEQCFLQGAVGMVLANDEASGNDILADAHVLPASHVSYSSGVSIFSYINSTKNPIAYITPPKTVIGVKPAPVMAAFSSKGPSTITPEILKPDITAPGVSVIAAYTEDQGPTNEDFDRRRVLFNSVSGTSMSCPHVSGIAGLLKTMYPQWSPAAIKSAIMTTAMTRDNEREPILNATNSKADWFSYGAGHVRPNEAMDPGLVYDLTVTDYLDFLCSSGYNATQILPFSGTPHYKCSSKPINLENFNYPSITVPNFSGSITLTRTIKNVGSPGTYVVLVKHPPRISVSVSPKRLKFNKIGEEKSFTVTLTGNKRSKGVTITNSYAFGELVWSDGKHYVRSPIVVNW